MRKNISSLTKKELLKRAEKFIFSTGLNDEASILSKRNMNFGLAQMQLILEKYGFEPKATFISTPDETVSRNQYRWNSGFGYGGRINWGKGNDKIIFLNTKPNQCGILAGGLEEAPGYDDLIEKIDKLSQKELYYENILIDLDYGASNHFINCFETKSLSKWDLPPYIFMIHGSAPEFRDDTYGLGIYIDKSNNLRDMAIKEETIFGTQYILLDNDATEYLRLNNRALNYSNEKRKIIAEYLFGKNFKPICSQPHQFLYDYNNIYLGCNCTDIDSDLIETNYFPIALRADSKAYLLKGNKNFSESTLKTLNFFKKAEELELLGLLKNANVMPHGGGYSFPDIKTVTKILEINKKRYFVCKLKGNTQAKKICRNLRNVQFIYRSEGIIEKVLQLNLGKCIAELNPLYSLKV